MYDESTKVCEDVTDKKVGEKINLPAVKEIADKGFSGWYLTSTISSSIVTSESTGGVYSVNADDAKNGVINLYALYYDLDKEIPHQLKLKMKIV